MDNKLERKPYRLLNPLGNTAKYENLSNIQDNLSEISKDLSVSQNGGGVPLYYYNDKIYVDSTDSHTLVIGATGSKKTRLVVLPTCLILANAQESMIITDPKAEIYNRTAKRFQDLGYRIEVLNFRDPSVGNCWNPFSIPHAFFKTGNKDKAYEFINDIGTNLFLGQMNYKDPFWDYSASDMFFGLTSLALRLSEDNHEVNIRNIIELRHKFFLGDHKVDKKLLAIAKEDIITSQSLLGVVTAPEKTQDSILTTFDQKMRMFSFQDNLLDMISSTSLSLEKVGIEKTVIYLIMPDEKTTLHPLISLFIKQSYEYLINLAQEKENEGKFKVRINYVLDEFSALPKIGDFPAMITAARSRNIRFNLIVQSGNQLLSRYKEEASTIKGNCNNWIFLYSKEVELLEEISKLCGLDEKSKPMISVLALQHLDKEKGEAIVLSNRLFPILSNLKDIGSFDNECYDILPFEDRRNKMEKDNDCSIDGLDGTTENILDAQEEIANREEVFRLRELNRELSKKVDAYREKLIELHKVAKEKDNDAIRLKAKNIKLADDINKLSKKIQLYTPSKSTALIGVCGLLYILVFFCSLQYLPFFENYIKWPAPITSFLLVATYSLCLLSSILSIKGALLLTRDQNKAFIIIGAICNLLMNILTFVFIPTRRIAENYLIITVIASFSLSRSCNILSFLGITVDVLEKAIVEDQIEKVAFKSMNIDALVDAMGSVFLVSASLIVLAFYPTNTAPFSLIFFALIVVNVLMIVCRTYYTLKEEPQSSNCLLKISYLTYFLVLIYLIELVMIILHKLYC